MEEGKEKVIPVVHISSHGYRPFDNVNDPKPPNGRPRRRFKTQLRRHFRAFAQGNGIEGNKRYVLRTRPIFQKQLRNIKNLFQDWISS